MNVTGTFDRTQRTLVLKRQFKASIDDVWASIVESDRLSRWFGTWSGDPSTGTVSVTMNAEAEPMPPAPFEIQACEPPRLLSVSATDAYGSWRLEAQLTEADGETSLVLTQRDVDPDTVAETGPGWEWYLDRLVAAVDESRMPSLEDFDGKYMPMSAQYTAMLEAQPADPATA